MGKLWLNTKSTGHRQMNSSYLGSRHEHPHYVQSNVKVTGWRVEIHNSEKSNGLGRKGKRHLPKRTEGTNPAWMFSLLCFSSSSSQGRKLVCWEGRRSPQARTVLRKCGKQIFGHIEDACMYYRDNIKCEIKILIMFPCMSVLRMRLCF